MARYVIHVCLLNAWCISIQRRLTNRQVRNLLIAVGILMAFWLPVRTVKYEWIADRTNPIGRYIWYSYYIPMVLIPLIGFFVVKYIDKPIDYDHPKWMNYLAIPAVLLLIVDEDFQPHYVSGGALPLSEADIAKTQTGAVHMENTLLRSTPIRACRMGQARDVLVYRLLADETIDERMLEILSAKQKEFDAFAEDSVIGDLQMQCDTSWLTKLVQEEQSRLGQQ